MGSTSTLFVIESYLVGLFLISIIALSLRGVISISVSRYILFRDILASSIEEELASFNISLILAPL